MASVLALGEYQKKASLLAVMRLILGTCSRHRRSQWSPLCKSIQVPGVHTVRRGSYFALFQEKYFYSKPVQKSKNFYLAEVESRWYFARMK